MLRCTGADCAHPRAWSTAVRHRPTVVRASTEMSSPYATDRPYKATWSIVWLAPTPRSSGGRSAVSTSRRHPRDSASTTAGCRLAAAVPDVAHDGHGRPDALPARARGTRPTARRCGRAAGAGRAGPPRAARRRAARCASRARAPPRVTPHRTSSSTTTVASAVDGFTRPSARGETAPIPHRPPDVGGVVGPRASAAGRRQAAGHPASRPRTVNGSDVTSPSSSCIGGQAAGVRQLRQRSRQRDARGDPDRRLHRARDDHGQADLLGDPQRRRARRRAAATFSTAMSAASSRATRSGSSARRIDSSAATRTSTRRRTAASSSTRAAGLLGVLETVGGRSSSRSIRTAAVDVPAAVGVDPHLPVRPSASRTAATRTRSSRSAWPGLGHLHLRGPQPAEARTISCARSGPPPGR